ncbi:hypothetical protein FKM82_008566 [Ascaphus truei]
MFKQGEKANKQELYLIPCSWYILYHDSPILHLIVTMQCDYSPVAANHWSTLATCILALPKMLQSQLPTLRTC